MRGCELLLLLHVRRVLICNLGSSLALVDSNWLHDLRLVDSLGRNELRVDLLEGLHDLIVLVNELLLV